MPDLARHRGACTVGGRRRCSVRHGRRAERSGGLGGVRRARGRGRPHAGSGAGRRPWPRHAHRRSELPRCGGDGLRAERHVHQPGVRARRHRHRLAVGWGGDRHRRRGPASPCRHLVVRVDGQQDRRQRQRPAAAVGRRRADERRPAVPRVVRRPGPLRSGGPRRVTAQTGRRPQERPDRSGAAWRGGAHGCDRRRRGRRRRVARPHRCAARRARWRS